MKALPGKELKEFTVDVYILYLSVLILLTLSFCKSREKTKKALMKALRSMENILPELLSVLMLIALVLSLLNEAAVSRYLGDSSGFAGLLVSALAGAVTLIPGFIAFPVAARLLESGAGVLQVAAFVTSLMMVGIITLPVEIRYFGRQTAVLRNLLSFLFVFAAASFVALVAGVMK